MMFHTCVRRLPPVLLGLTILCAATGAADAKPKRMDPKAKQGLFERVFGDAARLDPAMHREVLAGKPGKRHYVDADGNGKPEEVWFVDTDARHPKPYRPVLVKVVDRDGNLKMGHEPDVQSDLYIVDWNGNGLVDSVVEYNDLDGDGNVDESVIYFERAPQRPGTLTALWARDVGHDHLLWYDVAYMYEQKLSQTRSHFGGAEEFAMFHLDTAAWRWVPYFENPFVFYDHDRDGVTEEAIRVEDREGTITTVRQSFDAKNAGTIDDPRRFNVSLTALAQPNLRYPAHYTEEVTLAGIRTRPFLKYDLIRDFLSPVTWSKTLLTWSENDHNVDAQKATATDFQWRWEGVINHPFEGFPQVGGPSCGPFNKRFELVNRPKEPPRLYYHPADHRLHLQGADRVAMTVDADMDYRPEMRYDMLDTDGDGRIDTWKIDCGVDGNDRWQAWPTGVTTVRWNWSEVCAAFAPMLRETLPRLFALDQRLEEAVRAADAKAPEDRVFKLLRSDFASPWISREVARRLMASDESVRFYLDVVKDRLIIALKLRHTRPAFWSGFNEARSAGDYDGMRTALEREFKLAKPTADYSAWVAARRAAFEEPAVGWAQDWIPPNIGWESEKIAYRAYWGQFDFYGKKIDRLIYANIAHEPYHSETDWGIDALHVGKSCGCGGVTLHVNGTAYPVRNPEGKGDIVFEKRLASRSDKRVTVELFARGVGPKDNPYTVRFHCSALAGRRDSPVEIVVEGGRPDDVLQLGIGLLKLPQESLLVDTAAGVIGSWGAQTPEIGTIGLGLVFPRARFARLVDLPDEHQVVVDMARGQPLTYCIQCDWLRGRRFPRSPSASDWLDTLRRTAARVRSTLDGADCAK